jgi:hypothetical protein
VEKADKIYAFLTIKLSERIVCEVDLNCRHFISAFLIAALLAGGLPYPSCMAGECASNTECASAHCKCCGTSCPWPKTSHESHNHDARCNQQCPLINQGKAVAISSVQPLATTILGTAEVQPFLFGYTSYYVLPIHRSASLHPPTLLSLACALTI